MSQSRQSGEVNPAGTSLAAPCPMAGWLLRAFAGVYGGGTGARLLPRPHRATLCTCSPWPVSPGCTVALIPTGSAEGATVPRFCDLGQAAATSALHSAPNTRVWAVAQIPGAGLSLQGAQVPHMESSLPGAWLGHSLLPKGCTGGASDWAAERPLQATPPVLIPFPLPSRLHEPPLKG